MKINKGLEFRIIDRIGRDERVRAAAKKYGFYDRWIMGTDLELLLTAALKDQGAAARFLDSWIPTNCGRSAFPRSVYEQTGLTIPENQELWYLLVNSKSDSAAFVNWLKFTFGSLGVRFVCQSPCGIGHRAVLVELTDTSVWKPLGNRQNSNSIFENIPCLSPTKYDKHRHHVWVDRFRWDRTIGNDALTSREVQELIDWIGPPPSMDRDRPAKSTWTGKMFKVSTGQRFAANRQVAALVTILRQFDGSTVYDSNIVAAVTAGAASGILVTTQPPERILAYYRRLLIDNGVLTPVK